MVIGLVAGRAAEEIVFDTVTTGAANDIEKATKIARAMITQYGMSKKFGLMGLESIESKYLDGRAVLNCSDNTAADIDNEVMKLLKDSYKEAKRLLKENRELMDTLAEFLIEKETITGKEFMKIFREAKGIPEPEEKPKDVPAKESDASADEKEALVENDVAEKTDTEDLAEVDVINEEAVEESAPEENAPIAEETEKITEEKSKENVGIFSGNSYKR